ncbi:MULTISPECIES: hypothetical protein [Nostocales]|uniref:Bacteriocin n=3 Tax=Nostocales TaxID=1161 RepID=A0A0C1RC06_9CYAN|nr:hypothetical protein [Tolypothrix bouteillei]KAF3887865.1 hypothetical protein DA73_0400022000 [Tolypothrix bouteillei VB521301]
MINNEAVTKVTQEVKEWEGELDDADLAAISGGGPVGQLVGGVVQVVGGTVGVVGGAVAAAGGYIAENLPL